MSIRRVLGVLLVAGHPAQESPALYEQVNLGEKWRLADAGQSGDGFLPNCRPRFPLDYEPVVIHFSTSSRAK